MMFRPDIREATALALKENTHDAHHALEELLIPTLRAVRTPSEYAVILKSFYGYFQPLEKYIEKFISEVQLPDIKSRRKAEFILKDLKALGLPISDLSISPFLPSVRNEIEAWGVLYVMEGSTLGGRGITGMLLKKCTELSLDELNFFNGYGEDTGKMWLSFQQTLNHLNYYDDEMAILIASANRTFLNFKKWIERTIV